MATPGDTDTDAGRRGEILLSKCCKWSDKFYNRPIEELREMSQKDKKNGVFYMEYSYSQIGLTYEWFKNISQKIGNMITVRREILLQRLRGSSNSPYDRDDLDKIIDLAKKPKRSVMLNKYYRMDIYEEFNRNIPYIVGVDCSNGSNRDSNAFTVINPYSTAVVAEFECSFVGDSEWMKCLIELVTNFIPRAILCIERNHVGQLIIQLLLHTKIAGRIYFDKFKELADERMDDLGNTESMLRRKAQEKTHYGVWTGPKSRDAMFAILADRIKSNKEEFVGQNVTRDITKLVQKGAKILAQEPWHDDSVMSYLIGMYVYYYGNNLETFGFSKGDVVSLDAENQGLLDDPNEINTADLPSSVSEFVSTETGRNSQSSYYEMYRSTLLREQEKERMLHEKGIVHSDTYENTLSGGDDEYFDDFSDNDFNLFDELNNVGSIPGSNPGGNSDIFGLF